MEGHVKGYLLTHNPDLQHSFQLEMDVNQHDDALESTIKFHRPEKMIGLVIAAAGIADRILAQEAKEVSALLRGEKVREIASEILDGKRKDLEKTQVRNHDHEIER